jgi:hypothetical protein
VKISVNYLSVSIYLISMSPFLTWSLRKWCLLSRCLIILWKTGFFATHGVHNPLDLGAAATYSASVVDWATEYCFREDQQTREDPRK